MKKKSKVKAIVLTSMATMLTLSGCGLTARKETVPETADIKETETVVLTEKEETVEETVLSEPVTVFTVFKENGVSTPEELVEHENRVILDESVKLNAAKKKLDKTAKALNETVERKESLEKELEELLKNEVSEEDINLLNMQIGEAMAVEDILKGKLDAANRELDDARNEYSLAVLKADTKLSDVFKKLEDEYNKKTEEDATNYQNSLKSINDEYNQKVDAENNAYELLVEEANINYETVKEEIENEFNASTIDERVKHEEAENEYKTVINNIDEIYKEALTKAGEDKDEALKTVEDLYNKEIERITLEHDRAIEEARVKKDTLIAETQASYSDNLKNLKDSYDKAIAAFESKEYLDAKAKFDEAVKTQEESIIAMDDARRTLEESKNELNAVLEEKTEYENTVAEAISEKEELTKKLEEAQKVLNELSDSSSLALENVDNAKKAKEDAEKEVSRIESRISEMEKVVEVLRKGTVTADYEQKLKDAQEKYANAQNVLTAAQAQIDLGSYGFFKAQGSTEAMAVLDYMMSDAITPGFEVRLGEKGDATSLDNMKIAIENIAVGNQLITTDEHHVGCSEWLVNDTLMALAQANAEHSKNELCHWMLGSQNTNDVYIGKYNKNWATTENLAWGYEPARDYVFRGQTYHSDGVFDGWYHEEKESYETHDGGATGHYENMFRGNVTGLATAINDDGNTVFGAPGRGGDRAWAQELAVLKSDGSLTTMYGSRYVLEDSRTYTQAEYYERFMAYYNEVMKAKNEAAAALKTAETQLNNLLNRGESYIDEAAINEKMAEIENARALLEKTQDILVEAEIEFDDANTTYQNTLAELNKAEAEVAGLSDELSKSEDRLNEMMDNSIDEELRVLIETVKNNEKAYEDVTNELSEANEDVVAAEIEFESIDDLLNEELDEAKKAYDEALDSLDDETIKGINDEYEITVSKLDLDKADQLKKADEKYKNEVETAETEYSEKVAEADEAKKAATENAESKLEEADLLYEESVAEYKKLMDERLNTAGTAYEEELSKLNNTNRTNLEKMKSEKDELDKNVTDSYASLQNKSQAEYLNKKQEIEQEYIAKLEDLSGKLEQAVKDAEEQIRSLEKEKDVNSKQIADLTNRLQDSIERKDMIASSVENLKKEIGESEIRISTLEAEYDELLSEYNSLKNNER